MRLPASPRSIPTRGAEVVPESFIAGRFAFRQRSRSRPTFIVLIAVLGIALGTAALILTLSVVKGFASSIEGKLIGFSAHMQLRQPDERLFAFRPSDLEAIASHPEVTEASPFLEKSVVVRSRTGTRSGGFRSRPAQLRGVTVGERERFLGRYGSGSSMAEPDGAGELRVVVGKSLAETLGAKPGDKLLLIATDGGGRGLRGDEEVAELLASLDLEVAVVESIYDTGLQEGFDDFILLCDLGAMQERFAPGMISGYDARVATLPLVGTTVAATASSLGYPFYGYTVYQRYANLFEWLKLQKNITPLLIVTITIVAVFNIISTLLVLIIEKTREIGMLSALGLPPWRLSSIFLRQALLIALTGITAGNLAALLLTALEERFHFVSLPEKSYFITHVPLQPNAMDHLAVSGAVLLLTLLFALLPARVAASLKPGTALGS